MNRGIAAAVGASVLLQAPMTLWHSGLPLRTELQVWLVTAVLAAAIYQLWLARRHWFPHLDMLLLMGGFGGLAMAAADLPYAGLPACHRSASLLIMGLPMWLAGVIPALFWSRCLRQARAQGRLAFYLAIDLAAMILGMYAAHFATATWPLPFHHAAMCAGMLLGMGLAMPLRPWLSQVVLWNSSRGLYVSHPPLAASQPVSDNPFCSVAEHPDPR